MAFKDFFDIHELFNPTTFYSGEIVMGNLYADKNCLVINSKIKDKRNLYLQFLEKYYYEPMTRILNSESLARTFLPVISLSERSDGKRKTTFSFQYYVLGKIKGSVHMNELTNRLIELEDEINNDFLNELLRDFLRKDRKMYSEILKYLSSGEDIKYRDVLEKGMASPYYAEYSDLYNEYKSCPNESIEDFLNKTKRPQNYCEVIELYKEYVSDKKGNMKVSFFLDGLISGCTKTIVASRQFLEFFSKELKTEELVECFDYDKFCLIAAKSVMDSCIIGEQAKNKVHNSVIYLLQYLQAVRDYRKINPSYQCSITVIDEETNEKKLINIDDVEKYCEELLSRHPEFKHRRIEADKIYELLKIFGYDDKFIKNLDFQSSDMQIVANVLEQIEDYKELLLSWNIIPKGKREEKSEPVTYSTNYSSESLTEQEKIRRMLISKNYLENSAYLFSLEGINEFEGYQGYLYPNGAVVFEKYYDNVKTKKIASGSATYVMKLENFVELSKLSKSEIISKINSGEIEGVKRIFHREDMEKWKAEVNRAITGNDYTAEVVEYINKLLQSNVISKKNPTNQ